MILISYKKTLNECGLLLHLFIHSLSIHSQLQNIYYVEVSAKDYG